DDSNRKYFPCKRFSQAQAHLSRTPPSAGMAILPSQWTYELATINWD
ncbi:hypothetical protein A2U01_0061372, partial [Trifolium medium]|nr:hypothetical protein [Trifolium medium]